MSADIPQSDSPLVPTMDRSSLSKDALRRSFIDRLFYSQAKFPRLATQLDYYFALSYAVRDRLLQRWISTASTYTQNGCRTVAYLSAEFLLGPHLGNNLLNLGIVDEARAAMSELGLDLDELVEFEEEPGLGNGGLGRLAACFIDSLATLEMPALGYGIRYEFGIFYQTIVDGWQVEKTDKWLQKANPWEVQRPEWTVEVKLGGFTEQRTDARGRLHVHWYPDRIVKGVPYDTPILGYRCNTANTLRLWSAEAPESFDFQVFNRGDYYGAVNTQVTSENLSKVLYPNDEQVEGKQLRLEQQYFFVSCSLQDMLRVLEGQAIALNRFHEKFVIQLNDTHPAIAVAELMRLLVDQHALLWDDAWEITTKTFAYTNHTLLPEALERWPLSLFQSVLPRHLEIIYEINARFLQEVRVRFFGDEARVQRMSLIDESGERYVRMAHLACVGSFAINGVAELHSELLKSDVLADFYQLWPQKFHNVTNGVTPRRWLKLSNPRLARLLDETIGEGWVRELRELRKLEPHLHDAQFCERWRAIKRANKADLAAIIRDKTGVVVDPDSMFDVQVKRIHEYKRQHLAALHIIERYVRLKSDPDLDIPPRTFVFGGKAAPGYAMAKLIIKLITSIGDVVNRDPQIRDKLKVVFLPNFNVSSAQHIYPAADLSEQISTAGKEASGTGNMKFMMNGALTIGTLDGANVEMREEVGGDDFFLFGLNAQEVYQRRACGYRPQDVYSANPCLREVMGLIVNGFFSRGDCSVFRPLVDNLMQQDPFFVFADFQSYIDCQDRVDSAYLDVGAWTAASIRNSACSGKFSSDRSVRDYSAEIWNVPSVPIRLYSPEDVVGSIWP